MEAKRKKTRPVYLIAGHDDTTPANRIRVWASHERREIQEIGGGLMMTIPAGCPQRAAVAAVNEIHRWLVNYWQPLTTTNPEYISALVYDVQNDIDSKRAAVASKGGA